MTRRPLDAELVRRGLASTRSEAQEVVRAGLVTVGGAPATKPAALVAADQPVRLIGGSPPFVSRGGSKLQASLDRFDVDASGSMCLDAGASTGGFTDCLLRAGAARVVAVDVGYGQLAWELRSDPRVTLLERTNARSLSLEMVGFPADLIVADLSFISLLTVLPALVSVSTGDAEFVVLVKPQFEANRGDAPGGVVRAPTTWRAVLERVATGFADAGVAPRSLMASPLLGPAGNVEFFLHARRGVSAESLEFDAVIAEGEDLARS